MKILLLFDFRVVPHMKGAEIDYSGGDVRVRNRRARPVHEHLLHALSFVPVFVFFLASHWRTRKDPYPHLLVWAFIVGLLFPVFMTFAITRFRLPLDILFILFSAPTLIYLFGLVFKTKELRSRADME
jgi:heme A synthase